MRRSILGFVFFMGAINFTLAREDIRLSLQVPNYLLLRTENIPVVLQITNMSDKPLPLCTYDFLGVQLKFDFGVTGYKKSFDRPDITKTLQWEYVSALAETNLFRGESYDLDLSDCFFQIQEACADLGATNITADLLVGKDEWAKSKPCHIRVKPFSKDDAYWMKSPVFTARGVVGQNEGKSETKFFMHTIDGRKYLFNNYHQRICELPGDELPEFKFDEKTGDVSISQPSRKRRVHYNLKKMKVEPDNNTK